MPNPPDTLACQQLVELVTAYLEQKLPPTENARFAAHLAACSACRYYVAQMELTILLMGRLEAEELPAATQTSLLQVFRGWHAQQTP